MGYLKEQIAGRGRDAVSTAIRLDLVAARQKFYAAEKMIDAVLRAPPDDMARLAGPLLTAARAIPDAG